MLQEIFWHTLTFLLKAMKTIRHILATLLLTLPIDLLAQDTEIWVTLPDNPNRESNGIYGFPANDPQAITAKKTAPELYFQKGTGYQEGIIYGMDYQQGFFTADRYILYSIDTKTWAVTHQDVNKSLALTESACGMDGTVYALFEDGKLGKLDYRQLQRTDICKPQRNYVALGLSSLGELYGIDSQANLVRIATEDGAETIIGTLGISVGGNGTTGEIDPVSNLFYLACNTNVYAIDLQTCAVEKKGQLPVGFNYLSGMIIVGEAAASGAPAKATNLVATFEGNALSGTFAFTAPTETFNHQPLEDEMSYTLNYGTDGQYALNGVAAPGERIELPITLSEGGSITFSVKMANTAGEGQTASLTRWIGPDAPLAPQSVQLSMTTDGQATLTWVAPTACQNGGYLGELTYNVWRIVSDEETLVAQGISETSFSEQHVISTLKEYSYAVVAVNEGTAGERATSNKVIMGDGFGVPFVEHFGKGNHLEYFTVVNVNNDSDRWGELTWKLHEDQNYWGASKNYEEMTCPTDGATDDWLITPPIRLEPGQVYALQFKMKASYDENPEKFEVCMGRVATIEGMTTTLLSEQTITNTDYKSFVREFAINEAGSYCFGFHATPNTGVGLFLDDIEVRVNASSEAPSQVTDLHVVAEPTGELQAAISFTTPVTTISGQPLESITSVEVLRDDEVIEVIDAPAVGTIQHVTDMSPTNGYHVYAVIAYNSNGNGRRCESQPVYVGVDVPVAPVITRIEDHGNNVRFEIAETPDRGQKGFVVRPEEVSYEVWSTSGQEAELIYSSPQGEIERSFSADYVDTEDFDIAKWIVYAKNVAGCSQPGVAKIATGRPLLLPYRETFAMGHLKTSIWTEQSGLRSWNPTTEEAATADAGALLFVPYADGDQSNYNTQRLSFVGVKQPTLSFAYKLLGGSLEVIGWQPDGTETSFFSSSQGGNEGSWSHATVDLTSLKQQPYVVIRFAGQGKAGDRLFIDDVYIYDGAYSGVQSVAVLQQQTQQIYDLQGRRLSNSKWPNSQIKQGLYILNGKKLIK